VNNNDETARTSHAVVLAPIGARMENGEPVRHDADVTFRRDGPWTRGVEIEALTDLAAGIAWKVERLLAERDEAQRRERRSMSNKDTLPEKELAGQPRFAAWPHTDRGASGCSIVDHDTRCILIKEVGTRSAVDAVAFLNGWHSDSESTLIDSLIQRRYHRSEGMP